VAGFFSQHNQLSIHIYISCRGYSTYLLTWHQTLLSAQVNIFQLNLIYTRHKPDLKINKFYQSWNRLDMFIVIMSILAILVTLIDLEKSPIDPTLIRVIRVIRIARVLKLLKTANGSKTILIFNFLFINYFNKFNKPSTSPPKNSR